MPRKVRCSPEEFLAKQETYNKWISSSLAGIIRLSLDSEFRQICFDSMMVDNTNDLEAEVKRRLDTLSGVIPSNSSQISQEANDVGSVSSQLQADAIENPQEADSTIEERDLQCQEANFENQELELDEQCFDWGEATNVEVPNIVGRQDVNFENQELELDERCFDWAETTNVEQPKVPMRQDPKLSNAGCFENLELHEIDQNEEWELDERCLDLEETTNVEQSKIVENYEIHYGNQEWGLDEQCFHWGETTKIEHSTTVEKYLNYTNKEGVHKKMSTGGPSNVIETIQDEENSSKHEANLKDICPDDFLWD